MDDAALIGRLQNAGWRELLLPLLDDDKTVRDAAYVTLDKAVTGWERGKRNDLGLCDADVPLLVEIGMTAAFPASNDWSQPAGKLLFAFVRVTHASLARTIAAHFAAAADARRLDALTILAAQHTEEAMRTLGALIEQHGLPARMYNRFFWELNDSCAFADLVMPQLVLRAGRYLPAVVDFINVALERGRLALDKLVPARALAEQNAAELLGRVLPYQRAGADSRWRYAEDYVPLSHPFGAALDLLSMIPGASHETLHAATALTDPRLLSIVVAALLRQGVEPPLQIVHAAAASHATRASLYRMLDGRGRLDLFPAELATFECFAASHIAAWLAYPAELGYEPELLQLEATVRGTTDEGERQWCLWKFADADGAAFAAVSGPYDSGAPAGPLSGSDAFSNFTEWDAATPEQHLESVLETLRDWRLALCERGAK
jgi:hypothetical protein